MFLRHLTLGLCFFASSFAFAASDGSIGTSSTGQSTISVDIPRLIIVRSMADFTATWSLSGAINLNHNINVAVNFGATAATRVYTVTPSGTGIGGIFTVENSDGATVPYLAWYNDTTGTGGRQALTANTIRTNQTAARKPLSDTTANANLSIRFRQADLNAADGGTYTGSITLIFAPQ